MERATVVHLLSLSDVSTGEIMGLLDVADRLKQQHRNRQHDLLLDHRTVALAFEGNGFRTFATFAIAIAQLGGHSVSLPIDLTGPEPIRDIAGYLACWVDGMVVRTARHATLVELGQFATFPVVNAMTDQGHPCEVLADAQTIRERLGGFDGLNIVFVGAATNICASWFHFAARVPINLTQVCPPGYAIDSASLALAQRTACGRLAVTHDLESVRNADVVCTDGWPTLREDQLPQERDQVFAPYRITPQVMALARKDVLLMPCPPVTRGAEVATELMTGPPFIGYRGKENLLHMHKAILATLVA